MFFYDICTEFFKNYEEVYQYVISNYKPKHIGKEYHQAYYELKFNGSTYYAFIQK